MSLDLKNRTDVVASSFEQVPDEALLGFGVASVFTSMALYLTGHRDEGLFVGLLGTGFSLLATLLKVISLDRGLVLRT